MTLVKLTQAFNFKVAVKFMNTIVKFSDQIVDVSTYLLLGQWREHIRQQGGKSMQA